MAQLWAGFSAVAADNPHAAVREPVSAERIRAADAGNRPISLPYTKLMTANNHVDQAAALLMCTVDTARGLGIASDRWVFLHGASEAAEVTLLTNRADLARAPAIGAAGRAALDAAAVAVDEIEHVDVYSCFPSAVQVAAAEIGLALDRPLTVTGGLTFAGGPWNNYVTHSLATMLGRLRAQPDSLGLVTANGGLLTKHACGVYSTRPVPGRPTVVRVPPPSPEVEGAESFAGHTTVEASTVVYDRSGPEYAVVAARTADGRRAWARTGDPSLVESMVHEDVAGCAADIADGQLLRIN
jgi:acetyl-CoA C-acetyltransferase